MDIMQKRVWSRRHNVFCGPSPRARGMCSIYSNLQLYYASFCVFPHLYVAELVWQVRTHRFNKEQIDTITNSLIIQFCPGKSLNVYTHFITLSAITTVVTERSVQGTTIRPVPPLPPNQQPSTYYKSRSLYYLPPPGQMYECSSPPDASALLWTVD